MNIEHICNYNIVKNRSFDKIKIVWALKFQKRGDHFEKKGGLTPVPPPKSALVCSARTNFLLIWFIYHMLNIGLHVFSSY